MQDEVACWREARESVKRDIVQAIEWDRARERERILREPLPGARAARGEAAAAEGAEGAAAAAAAAAPDDDSSDEDDSFAGSLARKRPASAPAAASPRTAAEAALQTPEEMAEIELREYDALAELPRLLIPNRARGESPINLTHHWTDLKLRRPSRYLPVVALANHSAMATAGSTERYFRAVSFINDLKRTAQKKPSTIKRLSYLQSNPERMPFSTEIMTIYKERIIQRKQR